jgi:hypothetical protein
MQGRYISPVLFLLACGEAPHSGDDLASLTIATEAVGQALSSGSVQILVKAIDGSLPCGAPTSVSAAAGKETQEFTCPSGTYSVTAVFTDAAGKIWNSSPVSVALVAGNSQTVALTIINGGLEQIDKAKLDDPILMTFSHDATINAGTSKIIKAQVTTLREELAAACSANGSALKVCDSPGSFTLEMSATYGTITASVSVQRMGLAQFTYTAPATATTDIIRYKITTDGRARTLAGQFSIVVVATVARLAATATLDSAPTVSFLNQSSAADAKTLAFTLAIQDADLYCRALCSLAIKCSIRSRQTVSSPTAAHFPTRRRGAPPCSTTQATG